MGTAPVPSSSDTVGMDPMRSEEGRLSTFSSWPPNAKVEAGKIAKAGFFHTGRETEVKCLWCGCVLSDWEYGDQVMAKHRAVSPECPFVKNRSDNVPIENSSGSSQSSSHDRTDRGDSSSPTSSSVNQANNAEQTDTAGPMPMETNNPHVTNHSVLNDLQMDLSVYKSEESRLRSYVGWPLSYIRPADLAGAGFVYTGRADNVQCVFCREFVGEWDIEDFPYTEHRNLFPHCPFIRGLDVGNIPITSSSLSMDTSSYSPSTSQQSRPSTSSRTSYDYPMLVEAATGYDEAGIRPYSGPEKGPPVVNFTSDPKASSQESIGIIQHSGPAHPKYSTPEARLRTFRDWPPALKQQPKQLAEAGFYYIGLSDQAKCFYCDGGLRNWQPEDDPWTEHSRWFSKCGFVRLVKGDEFIAKCIVERPPENLPGIPQISRDKCRVTDEELNRQMAMPTVQQAMTMGIDASRIKVALKKKLQETGTGFSTANDVVQATINAQMEQESRAETENASLPSVFSTTRPRPESQPSATCLKIPTAAKLEEPQSCPTRSASAPGNVQTLEAKSTEVSPKKADDGSDLEQENRRLKEQRTCKICMDNEIGVVFLPCGHLICCVQCAPALKDCPLCRQPIHGTVKTFMS